MASNSDWLSGKRNEQLAMAQNWLFLINKKGKLEWNMNEETITQLQEAIADAESEINRTQSTVTAATKAQLKDTFDRLTAIMRDIKKRYFFVPPLTNADLVNLGLKPKDSTPTAIAAPSKPAEGDLVFPAMGLVEIQKIRAVGGQATDRSDNGVRIYCGILGTNNPKSKYGISERPETGDDLVYSEFTRKKNHRFDFSAERGKEVFFCMRYENSKGQTGPWGQIFSAFIP